jgi:hypothetical protein
MSLEALSLFHLRRAATLNEVRLWADPAPGLPLAAAGSLLLVFFSGIYLTIRMSAFGTAWPRVTIGAMLLLAPLAGIAAGRTRAIRRAGATASTINPDLLGARGGTDQNSAAAIRNVRVLDFSALWLRKLGEAC